MLSKEAKSQGIRYVFTIGSMSDMIKQRTKKTQRGRGAGGEEQQPFSTFLRTNRERYNKKQGILKSIGPQLREGPFILK
jgi:hypothetical protein